MIFTHQTFMMESEDRKISVFVCREEKLVFGLTRRTTCADVVQVLVQDQNRRPAAFQHSYCIVEKWRGSERILPNETRILRLWVAWGEEQMNVKFVLVKSDASLSNRGDRSAEARVVLSKHSHCVAVGSARSPVGGICPEKRRRIVRKAFRKLEKINSKRRKPAARRDASSSSEEKLETLAHLVISQDHTIRQQIRWIAEMDRKIGRCEAKAHFGRMRRLGSNYIQDTYLVGAAGWDALRSAEEGFAQRCGDVIRLQEELWEQEALVEILSMQMQEELKHWRRTEPRGAPARPSTRHQEPASGPELVLEEEEEEEERLKTQIDESFHISLRLSTDLQAIRSDLELSQEIYAAREKEMKDLLQKVNSLGIKERTSCSHGLDYKEGMMSTVDWKHEWMEEVRGQSKTERVNDDDSDTGLSSLHSQDSDSLPVWESLV